MEFYDYTIDLEHTNYYNMLIINNIFEIITFIFPLLLNPWLVCLVSYTIDRLIVPDDLLSFIWNITQYERCYLEIITMITSTMSTLCVIYIAYGIVTDTETYFIKVQNERAELLVKIEVLEKKLATIKKCISTN